MHNQNRILLLLVVLFAPFAAAQEEPVLDPVTAELVREAGHWLAAQAQQAGKGVEFPEYAEKPDETPTSLYAGSAGVSIFLENAAALLDDADLRELADRTAVGLLEARTGKDGAPTWAAGRREGGAGLYTGDAGVACAFLVRSRLRHDAKSLAVARQVCDGLLERSQTRDGTRWWDSGYDIIGGAAGTLLVLLELGAETGDERYGQAATEAGRWLARAGKPDTGPSGETKRLWWPARAGGERHYPNFSHGTAGISYALARVAAATGDEECLQAAVAGGEWLLAHATESADGLCWFHSDPGGEERFMEGWCHGPSGTARTFFALGAVTSEERFTEAALQATDWILGTKDSPAQAKGGTRFYSPSLCCGAAGVLDTVVDVYRATGDERYASYAREVAAYLMRLSKEDEHGRKWTNYDRADEEGLIYHSPSLMLGASGEALALLRLAAIAFPEDPVQHLPDRDLLGKTTVARPAATTPRRDPAPAPKPPVEATAGLSVQVTTPAVAHAGDAYVVVTSATSEKSPYMRAARRLAKWRKAEVITGYDPEQPELLIPRLRELGARYVAIVVPPEQIDTNTQRRFLMAAARLDDDIFLDVAFGFITGTRKTSPLELVERARAIDEKGIEKRWDGASVASSIKSTIYPGAADPTAKLAGYEGRQIYWGSLEADPDVLDFVAKNLPTLGRGGVLELSGCGDPEGIWLFSDQRNRERDKHWDFDPAKVGQDPAGEMPRITADRIAKMDLTGTLVWSGVCHNGALRRVFVEGDIVSTFGRVDHHTEYEIPRGRSIAEAILDAGAASAVLPVGANHGYRNLVEAQAALEGKLCLGDITRSTYDDIAMSQGAQPTLDLHLPGNDAVDRGPGKVMAGGGANRVLYGDPALAPFHDDIEPAVAVVTGPVEGGLRVEATVAHRNWWTWNMFSGDGNAERIGATIPLASADPGSFTVTVAVTAAGGEALTPGRLDAHIEHTGGGGRLLHLQVSAPRGTGLGEIGARATFTALKN